MTEDFLQAVAAFMLLAFPALVSVVNPLGMAFVIAEVSRGAAPEERAAVARAIALYSLIILMISFHVGAYVLVFFGISLPALRIAGGLVVALTGWQLLDPRDALRAEERPDPRALARKPLKALAFFPLTMPLTTGPGTISVAIALGTSRPAKTEPFVTLLTASLLTSLLIAALVYLAYRFADRLSHWIGPSGTAIVMRLSAFLLICIGVQIMATGVTDLLPGLVR